VEHGQGNAGQVAPQPRGPSLPPRPAVEAREEVWQDAHPELQPVVHHLDAAGTAPRRVFQFRTTMFRVITLAGWLGAVASSFALAAAMLPMFRDDEPHGLIVAPSADVVFGMASLFAMLAVYLGWFVWSTLAAFNASRLVPRSTSPWFPVVVYLAGPVFLVVCSQPRPDRGYYILAATLLFALAHCAVVASLRSTAVRIGGSVAEFSKLLILPLAWFLYRLVTLMTIAFFDGPWRSLPMLVSLVIMEALFPLGIGLASWRAMTSFDRGCERMSRPAVEVQLPQASIVAAALRRRAQEGR
jgi:hypothetical protein